MMTRKSLTVIVAAIVVFAIGSNDSALAGIDRGGKASSGSLTQFRSIFVNGVRFNTDQSIFIIDGTFGSESDLKVGQVVTVHGSVNSDGETGVAYVVVFDNMVEGPVSAVDPAANQLVVLGQTIVVNGDTSFSIGPGIDSVADFQGGDLIEVSGFTNAEGAVVATHISAAAAGEEFDVTGRVSSIDTNRQRLTIGELVVDYSAANLYGMADEGAPELGQRVEVIGSTQNASGEFSATRIYAVNPEISAETVANAEVTGLITLYQWPWNFEVDGVRMAIDWNTEFVGGWLFDLSSNAKVRVDGQFDANGRLIADSIEFLSESSLRTDGFVESVNSNSIIVAGTEFRMSADTEYEDDSDADVHRFGIDDIRTGDYVQVRGYAAGSNVIATRVEREDDDDDDDDDENGEGDD